MNDPNFERQLPHRGGARAEGGAAGQPGGPRGRSHERPDGVDPSRAERPDSADDWRDESGGGVPANRNGRDRNDERHHLPAAAQSRHLRGRETLPDVFSPASAYDDPPEDEPGLDLRKYLWLAFKHRWLLLGSAGVFLLGGLVLTLLTTPIYQASMTIQINRDVDKIVNVEGMQQVDAGRDMEFYQTQYELLKSRTLAERVVKDLALQDDAKFLSTDAVSPWTRLRRFLFSGGPTDPIGNDLAARQNAATGRLIDGFSVAPVRNSTIVRLSFDSPDPVIAAKIVNGFADAYIAVNLERRYESTGYARTFLEERLQQLKIKLEESERDLVAYAESQGIISTGESGSQTLSMSNLAKANDELAKATTERLRAELLWRQAETGDAASLSEVRESKPIEALRTKQAELNAEYQEKLSFFKPGFPEMRQLKAQINEIDRQIAAEINLIKESIKGQYEASIEEEKKLAELVNQLGAQVTDFRNRNIQYAILQREVDTNRSLYDGLLQRYKEIGVAGGVGTNNVSIVDRGQPPGRAYKPSLSRNLMIALVLGLAVGAGGAFVREHFDDTFKSPDDLEEHLGIPLLGIIPLAAKDGDAPAALNDPRSPIAEAYRSLRTTLQFSTSDGLPKCLFVTSSRPAEGKSTTTMMLAKNFTQLGMRVLLIDADLRRPSMHEYLKLSNAKGLSNYLAGAAMPPEAFQRSEINGLTFMACGPLPPNPAELLASPRMLSLLTIAMQKFDLVLVDGPPVVGLADAPLLSSMASATLLVVDAGNTRKGVAKAALKRLLFARAHVVGAVINKLDTSHQSYGYSYGYGYGYGDDSYYGADRRKEIASGETKPQIDKPQIGKSRAATGA